MPGRDTVSAGSARSGPGILDARLAASLMPGRDPRGHKGTFGHVLVVAGSLDHAGAALLTGTAALRAGCGLVTLCVPASLQPHLAGRVPELMTRGLPEDGAAGGVRAADAADLVSTISHDALVIGPGLRPGPASHDLVRALLGRAGPPAVVDAAAFDALVAWPDWPARLARACVLTPHPGELRRLGAEPGLSDGERADAAAAAAVAWRQVVVLKGADTLMADADGRLLRAPFEIPALATAGSGDVLSGIVGSLLAQGSSPWAAAALGVYLHATAALEVSAEVGDAGMLAGDLLAAVPRARRHLQESRAEADAPPSALDTAS
jgi:NAD(P)H-hydrate epimerase